MSQIHLTKSQHVFQLLKPIVCHHTEEFWVIALKPNKRVQKIYRIFKGTVDSCPYHPREVFRFLCLNGASSFIVAHNHPSQDPAPSHSDIQITKRLKKLSLLMEIPLVDHVIITNDSYFSFLDMGLIKN